MELRKAQSSQLKYISPLEGYDMHEANNSEYIQYFVKMTNAFSIQCYQTKISVSVTKY